MNYTIGNYTISEVSEILNSSIYETTTHSQESFQKAAAVAVNEMISQAMANVYMLLWIGFILSFISILMMSLYVLGKGRDPKIWFFIGYIVMMIACYCSGLAIFLRYS
jgi:ABC-type polysaccharide/polyol phosphate export permease